MKAGEWERVETDPPNCIVVHPDDRRAGALNDVIGQSVSGSLDGSDGPNLACAVCCTVVGTARTASGPLTKSGSGKKTFACADSQAASAWHLN